MRRVTTVQQPRHKTLMPFAFEQVSLHHPPRPKRKSLHVSGQKSLHKRRETCCMRYKRVKASRLRDTRAGVRSTIVNDTSRRADIVNMT